MYGEMEIDIKSRENLINFSVSTLFVFGYIFFFIFDNFSSVSFIYIIAETSSTEEENTECDRNKSEDRVAKPFFFLVQPLSIPLSYDRS